MSDMFVFHIRWEGVDLGKHHPERSCDLRVVLKPCAITVERRDEDAVGDFRWTSNVSDWQKQYAIAAAMNWLASYVQARFKPGPHAYKIGVLRFRTPNYDGEEFAAFEPVPI